MALDWAEMGEFMQLLKALEKPAVFFHAKQGRDTA
jgi:hypothetical protein